VPALVSIIVPVLNEAELIGSFLRELRARAPGAEIIVVDGESDDDTIAKSGALADHVLTVPRGRGRQMNAGAEVACGDVFLFVHADTLIPRDAIDEISNALRDDAVVGGCFRLRLPRQEWIYRISDSLGNIGVEIFGIALGDHGIFCRREKFFDVGGYPDVPLMEDAELYRALRRHGRMRQLRQAMVASPRRYLQLGPWRTTSYYLLILALYVAGTRMNTLTAIYRRLTGGGQTALQSTHSASLTAFDSAGALARSTTAPSGVRQ
jgi:rSAM/selenodomain-associated transferase 2